MDINACRVIFPPRIKESAKKTLAGLAMGLLVTNCSQIKTVEPNAYGINRSIVKILALSPNGKQNLGSGVVIGPNLIVTNCHVTRTSNRAYLIVETGFYLVVAQARLPELDLCILKTKTLNLPEAAIAEDETLDKNEDIIICGYPYALNLRAMKGKIIELHPYAQGQIIEINVGFNHGASGGGVFNTRGKLIGLMTFMGQENGKMHFYAIPATWIAMGLEKDFFPVQPFSARSFWEKGNFIK